MNVSLEDHLRTDGYVVIGSPPFISHEEAIWKGNVALLKLKDLWTVVINHLLTGMILQVRANQPYTY